MDNYIWVSSEPKFYKIDEFVNFYTGESNSDTKTIKENKESVCGGHKDERYRVHGTYTGSTSWGSNSRGE